MPPPSPVDVLSSTCVPADMVNSPGYRFRRRSLRSTRSSSIVEPAIVNVPKLSWSPPPPAVDVLSSIVEPVIVNVPALLMPPPDCELFVMVLVGDGQRPELLIPPPWAANPPEIVRPEQGGPSRRWQSRTHRRRCRRRL